jgi:hypothetical protein
VTSDSPRQENRSSPRASPSRREASRPRTEVSHRHGEEDQSIAGASSVMPGESETGGRERTPRVQESVSLTWSNGPPARISQSPLEESSLADAENPATREQWRVSEDSTRRAIGENPSSGPPTRIVLEDGRFGDDQARFACEPSGVSARSTCRRAMSRRFSHRSNERRPEDN